jgi:hypothetical protein
MVYILVTVGEYMGYLKREDDGGPVDGPMIKPLLYVFE